MGTQSVGPAAVGNVIGHDKFNELRDAIIEDLVGRGLLGAPEAGKNLGTPLFPWGNVYAQGLVLTGGAISPSQFETQPYKIVSGNKRSGSNQPNFLRPSGASGVNFTIYATSTPLVLEIAGQTATWTADKVVAGTVGPSSNHTATVNDATFGGGSFSRIAGEFGTGVHPDCPTPGIGNYYPITISGAGSNITNKVGSYAAFKTVGGEYLLAFIESSTKLSRCYRGFFSNNSDTPIKRGGISNGGTLTLMNLGWVFLDADGTTVDTTYKNPSWAYVTPSSPATGDYWFDQGAQRWKRHNGSGFVVVNRTLVGLVVLDNTNCVASRSFDFFSLVRSDNTLDLGIAASGGGPFVTGPAHNGQINVNGKRFLFSGSNLGFYTAASGDRYNASITPNTTEYCYVADNGATWISDIEPYWRPDLLGWYFPYHTWRCVGQVGIDGSTAYDITSVVSYNETSTEKIRTNVNLPGKKPRAGGLCLVGSPAPASNGLQIVRGTLLLTMNGSNQITAVSIHTGEGFTVSSFTTTSVTLAFAQAFLEMPTCFVKNGLGFTASTTGLVLVAASTPSAYYHDFIAIGQRA